MTPALDRTDRARPATARGFVGGPGWAAHLAGGGTTPWATWLASQGPAGQLPRGALPGAQELELLRRLNLAGHPSPTLMQRVLAAGGTGRGRLDLDLLGDRPAREYGPPPVDPGALPEEDLLRVAAGLVAEDLAGENRVPGRGPGRLPGRRRYRMVGDPRLADAARDAALRRGRRIGGRGSRVLVLGAGLEEMLVDAWCARSAGPGAPAWGTWLAAWVERDACPPRADLPTAARAWSRTVGVRRVHVVLDAGAVPGLLRVRRPAPPPPPPGAGAAELARRVGAVLGVLVEPAERRRLVSRVLLPRLATLGAPGRAAASHDDRVPGLPAWAEPWWQRHARAQADALAAAGYRVHGDVERLLERTGGGVPGPAPALGAALVALLAGRAEERR